MTVSTSQIETARSLLFVPGHRPDRFAKAASAGAEEPLFLRRNKNEREEPFHSSDTPNMIGSIWAPNEARDQVFRIDSLTTVHETPASSPTVRMSAVSPAWSTPGASRWDDRRL